MGATPLWEAFSTFSGRPTARLLAESLAASVALRLAMGALGRADLVVAATVALAQPFAEWLIQRERPAREAVGAVYVA